VPAQPGHGPALADCGAAARFYLAHRRARLDQVRQVRAEGAVTAPEVVARVYADVDRRLWWAAEWSVRAQLAYLDQLDQPDQLDQVVAGDPAGAAPRSDRSGRGDQSAHIDREFRESGPGAGWLETQ
jgi:hypothetical protein